VWDGVWLLSGAWGTGWAINWTVGSGADLLGAVNTIWSVVSVALWKWAGGLNADWGPLGEGSALLIVVEWLSLHDDILTEVLVTVHTGGEELLVWWGAGDTGGVGVNASGDLNETSSGWHSFGPGWLVEVWIGILHFDGGGSSKEKSNNSVWLHLRLIISEYSG